MRIISLDVGEKSLGICISDQMRTIAIPIENYFFERKNFSQAVERVLFYLNKYNDINLILVGYPLKTNGKRAEMTNLVDEFLEILNKKNIKNIRIKKIDERFSTKRGIELLNSKNKNNIKNNKDLAASYVMLADYLFSI